MLSGKKCSFCGGDIFAGEGIMQVRNDGSTNYYCSSKCRKNTSLKRDARKLKWTRYFKKGGRK